MGASTLDASGLVTVSHAYQATEEGPDMSSSSNLEPTILDVVREELGGRIGTEETAAKGVDSEEGGGC